MPERVDNHSMIEKRLRKRWARDAALLVEIGQYLEQQKLEIKVTLPRQLVEAASKSLPHRATYVTHRSWCRPASAGRFPRSRAPIHSSYRRISESSARQEDHCY